MKAKAKYRRDVAGCWSETRSQGEVDSDWMDDGHDMA